MLLLNKNKGFKWFRKDGINLKGYFFLDGKNISVENVYNYLNSIHEETEFKEKIKTLDGGFLIVIERDGNTFVAVDKLRTMPFFYSITKDYKFTDDLMALSRQTEVKLSSNGLNEFIELGCTIGNKTFLENFNQLQAGQFLICKGDALKIEYYFRHFHQTVVNKKSQEDKFRELTNISINVFERMIDSCNGRQILVPLSGGYDSRYIVSMLKKLKYENVVCYTYGKPNSFEVEVSKKVAMELGYDWHYIEYKADAWNSFINDSDYHDFSSNLNSRPTCQEYVSIKYLLEQKIIDNSTIVIPGYCGDLLGGSFLPNEIIINNFSALSEKGIENHILENHFGLKEFDEKDLFDFKSEIQKEIGEHEASINDKATFYSVSDEFFTRHRVAKIVVNAVRVNEYFDLEWRLPLWDCELFEYWYKEDIKSKVHNKLYNEHLFNTLFLPLKVNFYKKGAESIVTRIEGNKFLTKIYSTFKPVFKYIWHNFLKSKKYIDPNSMSILRSEIEKSLGNSSDLSHIKTTNGVIQKWYALKVMEKFKANYEK
ncbi:MAG: asparagine synthase (glutamine-hydrolyzing) [Mariniflexile sp.]|jgi:asparagine synthase (glutamine-hydrolysing)